MEEKSRQSKISMFFSFPILHYSYILINHTLPGIERLSLTNGCRFVNGDLAAE
jgi:hypothetical protein